MPSITARVASVLERSVSRVRAACSGLDPFIVRLCSSILDRAGGQAADQLALEDHDQHEQRCGGRHHGCDGGHLIAVVLRRAEEARDPGHHGRVLLAEQRAGHGEVVVGEQEAEQPGGNHTRPHDRHDHVPEALQPITAVDHGAFVQLARDVHEEAAHHPDGEGLIDRHEHDHGDPGLTPDAPAEQRFHVAADQRDMRHGAEHQRDDQQHEGIFGRRPGQRVTAQRAEGQADGNGADRDDHGVAHGLSELLFGREGGLIAQRGEVGTELAQRVFAGEVLGPVAEEVGFDLQAAPHGPDEGKGGDQHPQHGKAVNQHEEGEGV